MKSINVRPTTKNSEIVESMKTEVTLRILVSQNNLDFFENVSHSIILFLFEWKEPFCVRIIFMARFTILFS